jgi:hypothetical protein
MMKKKPGEVDKIRPYRIKLANFYRKIAKHFKMKNKNFAPVKFSKKSNGKRA